MIITLVDMATPILLASLGGLFTELAGVLNIALEGLMLTGAFTAVLVTSGTGSMAMGMGGAVLAGTLLALFFAFVTFRLRANIFITGLAVNLLAVGLTTILSVHLFGTKGVIRFSGFPVLPRIRLPFLDSIPLFGPGFIRPLFSGHTVIAWGAFAFLFLSVWLIRRTPFGLRLRAAGLDEQTLRTKGSNPNLLRGAGIAISGAACGLAGACLSLRLGAYVPNITAGRGWIALVAIYLGNKKPGGIAAACLIFAGAEYISNAVQGYMQIPSSLVLGFPYFITCIGMTLFSALSSGKSYLHKS